MRSLISFLLLSLALGAVAAADTDMSCTLPVCDIPQTIGKLQELDFQNQYAAIQRYTVAANRATDPAALQNLSEFAGAAKAMFTAIKADRVLIDASAQISIICLSRLAQFSELKADALIALFKKIGFEKERYEVLSVWSTRVKDYEDRQSLVELTEFFSQAGKICEAAEDDDYVVAFAKAAEQTAAKKLEHLQPILEGVYDASVSCDGKSECPEAGIDRLVVLDTLVADDVEVNLVVSRAAASIYHFANVVFLNGGHTIEGLGANPAGAIAKLHLDFDPSAQTLTGTVEAIDFKLRVASRREPGASPIALFDEQIADPISGLIPLAAFDRELRGTFAGKPASLRVVVFPADPTIKRDEAVGATLTIDEIAEYKLHFHAGRFFPKTGVLLLAASSGGGALKVALTIRPTTDGKGYSFSGIAFSGENARVSPVRLMSTTSRSIGAGTAQGAHP